MSLLGECVCERLDRDQDDQAARRAFNGVEQWITYDSYPIGDALAAEFVAVAWKHPGSVGYMGQATRDRARPDE